MKKEILESFGTVLAVAVAYVLKELAKWAIDKYKEGLKPFKMVFRNKINIKIDAILVEIGEYLGASRVYILSYHNSIRSHTGICHDYVSMTNEYNHKDLPPLMKDFQNIPTGLFGDLIEAINNKGMVFVPENEVSNMGGFHRAYGFKDAYKFRIGNSVANGTLSVVFTDDMEKLNQKDIQFISDRIILIDTLLKMKK